MTVAVPLEAVLDEARQEGITLRVRHGGKISLTPSPSPELRARLILVKPALIDHLTQEAMIRERIGRGACYMCKGRRFWTSRWKTECLVCHPPAPGAMVREFEVPG